ncbi:topology modulation protein [Parvibaculum sp.]|uniref:topology modulation protein n=1 Tax=Parvibaculum sp. TaxID=2024848 RepID=UPI00320C4D8E
MKRILVIGCSGGGKSTLARALGAQLDLPVIHLDQIWWTPGWVELGDEQFLPKLDEALAGERWIIDGNYTKTFDRRMPCADTIIWVDQPRGVCFRRALWRAVTQFGRAREDVAPGCPERIDPEFFRYVWTFKEKHDAKIEDAIAKHGVHAALVRLCSDTEIAAFLDSV